MNPVTLIPEGLREEIRDYIQKSFLWKQDRQTLAFDDDLLDALNSLQLLRLVLELESRYAVSIPNGDLTPENLGTVDRVAAYVALKLG